jgi:hypothetical protein
MTQKTKIGLKCPLPNIRIANNNDNNRTGAVSKKYNADANI